jgi:cysteine desulfurase
VQSAGRSDLVLTELGIDLLSISGHKLYGPKGVGVLYVRGGTDLQPLIRGGGQERGRRGGTENVPAVMGMARALELAVEERNQRRKHLLRLKRRLVENLERSLEGKFICNSPTAAHRSAPHILNIAFSPEYGGPVDGEMLLLNLDTKGICVSSGSACTSGAVEPSHVLQAVGLDRSTASAGVRFSLGKENTQEQIDYAVETLAEIVKRMRE